MTDDLTFTIERDARSRGPYPCDLRWTDGNVDIITTAQADYLEALQARATEPQGDYAALRADLVALVRQSEYAEYVERAEVVYILDAHPPLDLPDGFALTPTADAAAALAAVRTGKWTARHSHSPAPEYDLGWYSENVPDARFHMRPASPPPMVRVEIELPADASDEQIVAAFRAQGGA